MGTEVERRVTREVTVTSGGKGGLTVGVLRDFLRRVGHAGIDDDAEVVTFCPVAGQRHNFIRANVTSVHVESEPGEEP